jgi:hypothetical protein
MKAWMMNVLRGFGLVFLIAAAVIVLGEVAQIVYATIEKKQHELHWDPWLIAMGVASFGGLLWQTGKITETLNDLGKALPGVFDLVRSRLPGGKLATDPPPPPPPEPIPEYVVKPLPPKMEGE